MYVILARVSVTITNLGKNFQRPVFITTSAWLNRTFCAYVARYTSHSTMIHIYSNTNLDFLFRGVQENLVIPKQHCWSSFPEPGSVVGPSCLHRTHIRPGHNGYNSILPSCRLCFPFVTLPRFPTIGTIWALYSVLFFRTRRTSFDVKVIPGFAGKPKSKPCQAKGSFFLASPVKILLLLLPRFTDSGFGLPVRGSEVYRIHEERWNEKSWIVCLSGPALTAGDAIVLLHARWNLKQLVVHTH